MSTVEQETRRQVHPPDQTEIDQNLVNAYKDPPRDCSFCHTKRTRSCPCGGRIHNEMHDRLVEMCFSCGDAWA
jgi:hypothetical protein